ncbi:MAG: hypothetical protein GY814_05950 [Gammaproteobacteria bacterium]|nr:hypothetical protein [Gammaproteobacteria bacterium]
MKRYTGVGLITYLTMVLCALFISTSAVSKVNGDSDNRQWQWAHVAEYDLWFRKPAEWKIKSKIEDVKLMLDISARNTEGGIFVWGGDFGTALTWQQLAQQWEANTTNLSVMIKRSSARRLSDVRSGIKGKMIHFREYQGELKGVAVRTYVGYVTHANSGFVIMGIYPGGNYKAERNIRHIILSLRLNRPSALRGDSADEVLRVAVHNQDAAASPVPSTLQGLPDLQHKGVGLGKVEAEKPAAAIIGANSDIRFRVDGPDQDKSSLMKLSKSENESNSSSGRYSNVRLTLEKRADAPAAKRVTRAAKNHLLYCRCGECARGVNNDGHLALFWR